MGVMIGDAMGMPVEMMSRGVILEQTGGMGIEGFIHPIQRKIRDTEKLQIGSTTDDWQLTEAIVNSLIRRGCFDLSDLALSHIKAYEESTFGWGGTTRGGLKELKEYFDSRGERGRSPYTNPKHNEGGMSRGCGNGVAMKISPVAIYSVLNMELENLAEMVAGIGRLTHSDTRSWASGYAIAWVIAELISSDYIDRQNALKRLIKQIKRFEVDYPSIEVEKFADCMERLLDRDFLYGSIEKLIEEIGVGCIALESVTFAMAIFLRNPLDFRAGILEAVNAGGDTDTIAAMVGAMIGSMVGISGIPEEWIEYNKEFKRAIEYGKELYEIKIK